MYDTAYRQLSMDHQAALSGDLSETVPDPNESTTQRRGGEVNVCRASTRPNDSLPHGHQAPFFSSSCCASSDGLVHVRMCPVHLVSPDPYSLINPKQKHLPFLQPVRIASGVNPSQQSTSSSTVLLCAKRASALSRQPQNSARDRGRTYQNRWQRRRRRSRLDRMRQNLPLSGVPFLGNNGTRSSRRDVRIGP
jgi:hypothetical protein